ncbi:MAG: hypothetical protein JJE21_09505 [Spirochaetaceae bacterium]|nr:hypothetical protein [Spirochaetaceae bacterium]
MFKSHWLYPYIIPIYNNPNLEATMTSIGIDIIRKKDYIQIFPTNTGDLDEAKINQFNIDLKKCKNSISNLDKYVEYCIKIYKENLMEYNIY